ncbi:MAG: metallophosphoesterase [Ignavibacteria bacterium]
MKMTNFLIFFTIVFVLYSLVNFYVFIRGLQALPKIPVIRISYSVIFIALYLAYLIGRILERIQQGIVSNILIWCGSFWMAAVIYFLLIIIILDIVRGINSTTPIYPSFATFYYGATKLAFFIVSVLLVSLILYVGYKNSNEINLHTQVIKIDKPAAEISEINIAFASDIHLGTVVDDEKLQKIVSLLNSVKPDVIIFGGDLLDEDVTKLEENNSAEPLKQLSAKYGIYGVTGNHEYIGGIEKAIPFIEKHNITLLRDTSYLIANTFYLIGREDKEKSRFTGQPRKKLTDLLRDVDKSLPLILIDHQPSEIEEVVKNKIDLQISGHTHNGQFFPINLIVKLIYEFPYGYHKKQNTQFFISTGAGTWGPPIRIMAPPEVVLLKVKFGN